MQNFYDTVGTPLRIDNLPNFSDKLLAFAGSGNFNLSAMSFLDTQLNNNQNFLSPSFSGNSRLLSHQSNPLTNALALSQINNSQLISTEISSLSNLSIFQNTNMANMAANVTSTIRANVDNTNSVAQNSSDNNFLGGVIGGVLSLFSDRRLKRNIVQIGTLDNGLKLYTYEYVWATSGDTCIGVMADEVLPLFPDAITYHDFYGDGVKYMRVDYSKIGGPVNGR